MNSDIQYQTREMIDDTDYGYQDLKELPFETLLDMYIEYKKSNIWEHPGHKDTFSFLQYGIALRRELNKRDKKGSKIL